MLGMHFFNLVLGVPPAVLPLAKGKGRRLVREVVVLGGIRLSLSLPLPLPVVFVVFGVGLT